MKLREEFQIVMVLQNDTNVASDLKSLCAVLCAAETTLQGNSDFQETNNSSHIPMGFRDQKSKEHSCSILKS